MAGRRYGKKAERNTCFAFRSADIWSDPSIIAWGAPRCSQSQLLLTAAGGSNGSRGVAFHIGFSWHFFDRSLFLRTNFRAH
jgi:hypothetical protein